MQKALLTEAELSFAKVVVVAERGQQQRIQGSCRCPFPHKKWIRIVLGRSLIIIGVARLDTEPLKAP